METTDDRGARRDEPIHRLLEPIERFLHVEAAGGIVLLLCTTVALGLANSPIAHDVHAFWEMDVGFTIGSRHLHHSLHHWINDGLMVLFFFVVGLEVKREIAVGDLRDPQRAALPIVAALGGMLAPAIIYLALQGGGPAARGWGIVTATDIAFVVGCMALLGSRIPHSLRVMLLTLAIADDIGAILVIAIAYSSGVHVGLLGLGTVGVGVIVLLAQLGVRSFGVYTLLGLVVWAAFLESGIHATLAGVILGLLTPARPYLSTRRFAPFVDRMDALLHGDDWTAHPVRVATVRALRRATRETVSPLEYLETTLHPWVGFVVMPLFALANAGVPVHLASFADPVAVAVAAGLVLGKPIGIAGFAWLAVRLGIARLPSGVSWTMVTAGAMLAGIGFTMALFIAGLALDEPALDAAKVGVLAGSFVAAVAGVTTFVVTQRTRPA